MFPFLPFFQLKTRQDKTRQDKLTLSLDKSQMIPYWCLSLWRWCRQNYPLLFLPKLRQDKTRQDKTIILDSRLTDSLFVWLLHSLFDKNDTWAEQSNATIPLWWWPRSLRQDAVLWLREWVTPEDACLLLSSQMLFYDADPTWELSYATSSNTTHFHARAHTRHPTDIKMVPPRIELGS